MNTKIRVMKKIGGASLVLQFGGGMYQTSVADANFYDEITDIKMYRRGFLGFDEKHYVIYFKDIYHG